MPAESRIGPYEVLALLGQGGMGAVYRARDPRLDRTVAIKVLLEDAARDPSRRERFMVEARAVAALAHPGIVTIHSVEEDAGRIFLTMEYVEGRTVADIIAAGGLDLDRLLTLAVPLADAIAAAHEKGIIHRDLKPSNVMVSADGRVKVLDFGLAKLRDSSAADRETVTKALPTPITADGVILGTMAYMSPEQAEGRPVDHRTDIFALGVMLYEMATGRQPFVGDTSGALIASILRDMPPPVTEINAAMPAEFARIVRRCLTKDPTRRYQTALDVRNELEELQREAAAARPPAVGAGTLADTLPSSGSSPLVSPPSSLPSSGLASAPAVGPAAGVAVPAGTKPRRWLVPAVAASIMLTALVVGYFLRPTPGSGAPQAAPRSFVERQVTSNAAEDPVWYATISPDGKYVAYGDFTGIHLRLIDTGETRTIRVPPGICFT